MMNGRGKSYRPIQPTKPPNKAEGPAAEAVEGRGLAEGNSLERNALRTQRRGSAISALERVRQAARRHRQQRFTALLHQVYDSERWRAAYLGIKRDAAAGVDDETWRHYGEALEENLQDLSQRLKRGAYRAQPVRRAYIRKTAGLKHEWLVKFVEHRVADRRIVRLIQKWLAAGVLEDGQRTQREVGTVQGGSISPLLANLYLHYVFDLWVRQWRQKQARGDVIVVRFADDFVVGFEHRHEAERFGAFRQAIGRVWWRVLRRRSQGNHLSWRRM